MKKTLLLALVLSLFLVPVVLGSGSSGPSGVPAGASSVDPYKVTETMKCVVTKIEANGTVVVRDSKHETSHVLALSHNTTLSAQDKKAFGGRKALEVSDLEVGHLLKVVQRQVNGEVLKIKVLKAS